MHRAVAVNAAKVAGQITTLVAEYGSRASSHIAEY
jgi:hypothetical protein